MPAIFFTGLQQPAQLAAESKSYCWRKTGPDRRRKI